MPVLGSNGRWMGVKVVGDFRTEDEWYFDSVRDQIPDYLKDGEFETPEEYGEAVKIHAVSGKPDEQFEVDWEQIGQAILDQEYDYEAENAADIGKTIGSIVSSRHGDRLQEVREEADRIRNKLWDRAYRFLGKSGDFIYQDFEQQNEEAWDRVEKFTTEEALEVVENYSVAPTVIGIG